jgi:hypothetical protein
MDLARERTRLLERDAEWAALASEGRDVERRWRVAVRHRHLER